MTSFVVINPRTRKIETVNFDSIFEAQAHAGLNGVDHGVLTRGLGYCVYEYGMFTPPSEQHYFSLLGRLIAGPAVLYAYDEKGDTIDLRKSAVPDVRFYLGINDVEAAIHHGEIERPFMTVNGVEIWHWPQQPPGEMRGDADK